MKPLREVQFIGIPAFQSFCSAMKPDLLDFVSVFKYEMILHTVF
jgi:hypothetical protein